MGSCPLHEAGTHIEATAHRACVETDNVSRGSLEENRRHPLLQPVKNPTLVATFEWTGSRGHQSESTGAVDSLTRVPAR